jgi:hypothetical protein
MFQTTTTTRSVLFSSSSSSSSSSLSTSRRNRNKSFVVRVFAFDDDDDDGDGKKRIEREGLERREPRKRGPRRTIQQVVSTPAAAGAAAAPSDPSREEEGEEAAAAEAKGSEKKMKRTKKTSSSSSLTDRWMKDPLSALISIPRIALGATTELVVEKGGNPSDALNALAANAPRVFSSSVGALSGGGDGKEQVALMRDLEAELERLERKGAKAAKPVREALVKPNVDAETYERYFATRDGDEEEGEEKTGDDEDEDDDEGDEGFYDASNDTGTDEEVAKAANDVADALSGMDLADLYSSSSTTTTTEKEEEEEENGATRERLSLNVIAESVSRKAEMDGVSPEAVEYTIEENLSNVVMETATVSATRRRAVSSTTTTPTSPTEISNKYYSSATTTSSSSSNSSNSSSAAKEEERETTAASDNSYVQKFNGKWKRDDQLDESKLMDLFEMNNIFRAANSALTQLDVGASASQFSLKASYGIISVNESYSYDQEVRQNRRDARSGAQYGRVTLDSQSESITLESRWTAPLEGNMTETFVIENNRLLRKAKVTLLDSNKTWEGVYEYKRV